MKKIIALSPIIVLLLLFVLSCFGDDSHGIPVLVIFILTSVYTIIISKGEIGPFSKGAANERIMYMIWIFILAGIFAEVAKKIGSIDATVNAALYFIPPEFLPVGLFFASCFISFSLGTSVGTIVALCPLATGFAAEMNAPVEWYAAIVVGGSFFGDNLSFISDTTIVATQTQGCSMKDKFYANLLLVIPAAIATILIYFFTSQGTSGTISIHEINWVLIVPYILIILLAILEVSVLTLLSVSILVASLLGLIYEKFDVLGLFGAMSTGVYSMAELIVVTMLAGGILGVIRVNGGLDYIIQLIKKRISSRAHAEFAIAEMTAIANLCTANNTIAILSVGDIVKQVSSSYDIQPKRAASIMDTTSCFVQGIIPYGAQLLMASQIANIPSTSIISYLYYPFLIAISVIISIIIKTFSKSGKK